MVMQISWQDLQEDPKRGEAAAIQREAGKDQLAIRIKAENQRLEDQFQRIRDSNRRFHERRELERQSEFERMEEERQLKYEIGKLERQSEFEREEKARQHMFDLHYQLRVAAAQELKEILRERIRDAYDRGRPIDDVAEESLKLLNVFHDSFRRGYVFSTLSHGSSENVHGTSPDAGTISRDEDTTIEYEVTTDPINVPPDMSDLSGTKQKELEEE